MVELCRKEGGNENEVPCLSCRMLPEISSYILPRCWSQCRVTFCCEQIGSAVYCDHQEEGRHTDSQTALYQRYSQSREN